MKTLTILFMVGMFLTAVAMADEVDDIKAADLSVHAAFNAGNANAVVQHYLPERTTLTGGGLLRRFDSLEEQRADIQARFDAGIKYNRQVRHLDVRVFGNTAVTTGYVVGTVTQPDGSTNQVNLQRTTVLIKQGGQWKQVHFHVSPLRGPQ
jgi:ketosteroid isomerase-like protein